MATETDPQFDTVSSIRKTVNDMQLSENDRAKDRALIDTLANGERPFTPEEVEKHQIKYNINWGGMKKIVTDANRQINGALLFKPVLFNAISRGGQVEKRDEYGQKFTTALNERLTRGEAGKTFTYLMLSRNASVCLHGPGTLYFPNEYCVLPKFVPMENLLIPTDTSMDFSDLSYFNIKVEKTVCELNDMVSGDAVDKGWNVEQVNAIISGLKEFQGINANNYNWTENPEKWQELFKQNRAMLTSDAVPKVDLDYFFSKEKDGKWYLKIFLRENIGEADSDEFVYQREDAFADNINQILQVQYGDTSVVPPLKYHSVRGLGQSVYSSSNVLNRFTSGLFQHGEEQLRAYLRVTGPTDRARQNVIQLEQYGILEDGVSFVPEDERHQVDAALIESIMAQCRQNQSENSTSFVQDLNDGTKKEITLGEAQIRQQSGNVQISSMLKMMYRLETFYYEETVRRFLLKEGSDEAKAFQKQCISEGIPKELMIASNWKIEPEQVLGSGDQTLALQEASALMSVRPQYDPSAQRQILRLFTSVVTRDPAKGMSYVPDVKDESSSGTQAAEDVFGTLMQGAPVALREGITQNDYVETELKLAGQVIQRISQADNMGTMNEVVGLATVLQDAQKHVSILESDPKQGENVKKYGDAIGKLQNLLKGFYQRIQESQPTKGPSKVAESISYSDAPEDIKRQIEAQAGLQPSTMPVTDQKTLKAQQQLAISEAKFTQKTRQSAINFEMQQAMKLSEHESSMSMEDQKNRQELLHNHLSKLHELMVASQQPESVPENN